MKVRGILPTFLLLLLLTGCTLFPPPTPTPLPPGWTEVPFTSIERNDYGYNPNIRFEPVVYLLASQADVEAIPQALSPDTKATLMAMDYANEIALVAGTYAGGHGPYIEIQHILYHDGMLVVSAERGDPQGYSGAAEEIYPSHVVRVARSDVPGPIESVQLEVETVIVTPTPIPM